MYEISLKLAVTGLSQKICLFFLIANSIIFLCVLGGDEITIASSFLSEISSFQFL